VIRPLLSSICTTGTTYASASGAFSILTQPSIMKRINANWELTAMFLRSISGSTAMLSGIEENDKREILLNRLTSAFCTYSSYFHHQPFDADSEEVTGITANIMFIRK
jgi:hypothetical protein